jgi:hypothetical protein
LFLAIVRGNAYIYIASWETQQGEAKMEIKKGDLVSNDVRIIKVDSITEEDDQKEGQATIGGHIVHSTSRHDQVGDSVWAYYCEVEVVTDLELTIAGNKDKAKGQEAFYAGMRARAARGGKW